MEAGRFGDRHLDLIDAMVMSADAKYSDEQIAEIERCACPGCGSCSGMFTANSMNCLTEALGLSLPGNGTIVATHANRRQLFEDAAAIIVRNAERYYFEGDERPARSSATRPPSKTPCRSISPWAARPTRSCTCWPWHTRPAWTSRCRISTDSRAACRCSARWPPNSHYHIQGRQPCGRHLRHPRRTQPRRAARHLGAAGRRTHARRSHRGVRHPQPHGLGCRPAPFAECPRPAITAANWVAALLLRRARHRPRRGAASATSLTPTSATAAWPS